MPLLIRMDEARNRCRRRVDMARNQARDNDAFNAVISEVYGNLWAVYGGSASRYFETSTSYTATGAATYDEPADHMHTVRMARVRDDGTEVPMRELAPQEEAHFKGAIGEAVAFSISDGFVHLYPNPSSGTYKLYYVQQATDLSEYADDDIIDLGCGAGLSYLLWGVAVIINGELEGNATLAMRERDKWEEEARVWAANRNLSEPKQRPRDDTDEVGLAPREWYP